MHAEFQSGPKRYNLQLETAVNLAQSAQQLSKDMLTRMLDETSQRHLLSAADYLDAVLDRKQSFVIYEFMLAAEQATDRDSAKPRILSPVMMSCARAAETSSQQKIAREALLKRIGPSQDYDTSPSENSLAHKLLAQIFALDGRDDLALLLPDIEWNRTLRCGSVNTSFDVLAYLHHKIHESRRFLQPQDRSRHIPELTGWDAFTRKRPSYDQLVSVNEDDFVLFALGLRDASLQFQLVPLNLPDPSTSVSEHVESCLDWCINSIDASFPVWKIKPLDWDPRSNSETHCQTP